MEKIRKKDKKKERERKVWICIVNALAFFTYYAIQFLAEQLEIAKANEI